MSAPPKQDLEKIKQVTDLILKDLEGCDLQTGLSVVTNIAGQLLCILSDGRPSTIQSNADLISENIRRAAVARLLHEDQLRRKREKEEEDGQHS